MHNKAMTTSVTDDRQAFEAWYATNAFDLERNPIGSRECGLHWPAWKAALRSQGKVVKVSDLQRLVDEWSDASYFSDVTPESVRDRHASDLVDIIDGGGVT